ncbi:Uncharacterised protein [Vibrio cholerae]|nr:Uncharacterised protein [Vibrio cholerae]CSI34664.1 Uncharacterised protein [Vibrio cholerae]CSI93648.1 Uncharacterised protein [Vibrio cholerae]
MLSGIELALTCDASSAIDKPDNASDVSSFAAKRSASKDAKCSGSIWYQSALGNTLRTLRSK